MRLKRGDGHWLLVGGPVPRGSAAITLGPLVSVRKRHEHNELLLRHELEHVRQWKELGAIGFSVRYVGSYLRWRLRGYGHWAAYRRIPLEAEAEWRARQSFLRADSDDAD